MIRLNYHPIQTTGYAMRSKWIQPVLIFLLLLCVGTMSAADLTLDDGHTWLMTDYTYRQQITVTNNEAALMPAGFSVQFVFDHAALVSGAISLANGDDVRIVAWDGESLVEIDRVLDRDSAWNDAATTIWFATQLDIGASGSDNNYYLFYGDPGAINPLADDNAVFLLNDEFNGTDIDASIWGISNNTGLQSVTVELSITAIRYNILLGGTGVPPLFTQLPLFR